ncbi:hypothetical protein B5E92_06755 [Erysipelatoclostridium sp. An15]|uniref:hypothetical protein n=1 Tax=Erysipelatoclostridium sp. An15 TaxID=1965566 RepID=UPI000B399737|nr:hypothetical protein [Erysipelatoclostridium sp. An15]OUQ07680.1 hypothetical protein B5E92_06755 [Erysipelatoclostridium sp. An15]
MKSYKKPVLNVERFTANEFVAACGDSGVTYLFTCDAGGGKSGTVYLETNGSDGLQTGWGGDQSLGGYHACGTEHEADSDDAFLNGYYVTKEYVGVWPFGHYETTTTDVIVWRGPYNDNVHCTTNLDQDSWVTGKS